MEQFDSCFIQVDVLPMVKHFMGCVDLFNLFSKYVPATTDSYAVHPESLCIVTANVIYNNKLLYKVREWLSLYSGGVVGAVVLACLFNDDRLARGFTALFDADRHSMILFHEKENT